MSVEHTIRTGTPDDAEAILVVHVAAIVAHGPVAYTDKQVAAWAAKTEGTDRYIDAISDSEAVFVVVEANSCVVGFGELDIKSGEIEAIFIDPEWNDRGIGSSVLSHFENRLRDDGFDVARLRAVLNAVGFYQRQGYQRKDRVTVRTTNNVELDSVRMEKPL